MPRTADSWTPYQRAVPPEFTRALLRRGRDRGFDIDELLRASGIAFDPILGRAQTARISPGQYSRLGMALFRALGDESGGIMPDGPTPVGTARMIALCMLGCADLESALRRAIEFNACCRIRQDQVIINRLEVDPERREATLSYRCGDDDPEAQHLALCGLAMWLRFCSWLAAQQLDIISASCAGPEPASSAGIRHFFPCPVAFDQPLNAVTFSARHLEARVSRSEAELEAFLALAPYHVLIEPAVIELSVTHRIRRILGDDFRHETPSFEQLTGLLNMSARTLRRRLEREGTSYQRIKDNARRDLAIRLLSRAGMTVSEVAERVGFSDPSAFHRSFKKWTGHAPGSYRQAHRGQAGSIIA